MLWLLLGCGSPVASPAPAPLEASVAKVTEIYDVPPPPGHRTVLLQGVDAAGLAMGQAVVLLDAGRVLARGELVDLESDPTRLTIYVREADTDGLLDHVGALVVRSPVP